MRVAIVGSRHFNNYKRFREFVDSFRGEITHIVSGGAKGADAMAEYYAKQFAIPFTVYPANWSKFGKGAGMIRNKSIVNDCQMVIAFPSPESKGTRNTIALAEAKGIPVHVLEVLRRGLDLKRNKEET